MDQSHIRNFSIIAHIDHGKSTLADRMLELTDAVAAARHARAGARLDGPRARARHHDQGAGRRMRTRRETAQYELNLIDTPGHVDFTYEVSRSLRGVRGRAARRGRGAGHRGADARQRLPGDGRTTSRSSRSSTRSTCRRATPRASRERDRRRARRSTPTGVLAHLAPRRGPASRKCSKRSSSASRRRRATPTRRCARSSSTPSYDAYRGVVALRPRRRRRDPRRASRSAAWRTGTRFEAQRSACCRPARCAARRARRRARSATSSRA